MPNLNSKNSRPAAAMMPAVIQDYVYTNIDKAARYEVVVEKIQSVVSNKVSMNMGPAPMDVGEVGQFEVDVGENEEIGAVGMHIRCHKCEGWRHMSRECPSKGEGKGGKGEKAATKATSSHNYNDTGKGKVRTATARTAKGLVKAIRASATIAVRSGTRRRSEQRGKRMQWASAKIMEKMMLKSEASG